jgi:FixJ family two-component response regulator
VSDLNAVVYIVDDDVSFRKSMERLILGWGYKVIEFESAKSLMEQKTFQHPSCLLLDVKLPDVDGISLKQKLIKRGINSPVIFMSGYGTISMSVKAMKDGAIDFLPKPFESKELRAAINIAIEQDVKNLKTYSQKKKIYSLINTLTSREKEIMQHVLTGKLNKQIAQDLGITEKTVKVHRSRVMYKLKISSVADLVRLAEKINISPLY